MQVPQQQCKGMVPLTAEALIRLASLPDPATPFGEAVVALLKDNFCLLDDRLRQITHGKISGRRDPLFRSTMNLIRRNMRFSGIGYLSSSTGWDPESEVVAAALIASAFQENPQGYKPMVVPIDVFYSFEPFNPSLVKKTGVFSEECGDPSRVIMLTDFTGSTFFTEDALLDIPAQEIADRVLGNVSTFCDAVRSLASYFNICQTLEKLRDFARETGRSDQDAHLLLGVFLLSQDIQLWQNLWYETTKDGGVSLYVVAPKAFHDAMNRLHYSRGHGMCDYHGRATLTLGSGDLPLFEMREGNLYSADDLMEEEMRLIHNGGTIAGSTGRASEEELKDRLAPIIERLSNRR